MSSIVYCFLVILKFLTEISQGQGQYCNETRSFLTHVSVPENYTFYERYINADGITKWRPQVGTRLIYKQQPTTKTILKCCKGYTKNRRGECIAYCQQNCVNGICTGPNFCFCNEGYEYLTQFKCQPKCDNCNHGLCVAPGICHCYPDFKKSDNGTCIPICNSECVNGFCSAPDICSCNEGYYLNETIKYSTQSTIKTSSGQLASVICQPHCGNDCINGYCSAPNICSCNDGYKKIMNSSNDYECIPHCSSGCDNGYCIQPEMCICLPGYEMNKNSNVCEPICSNGCTNGQCTEPEICECYEGFRMQSGSVSVCEPSCNPECDHGEFCDAPNQCRCAMGYQRNNETNRCQPHCPLECVNSNCTNPYHCECWEGYSKDSAVSNKCNPICADCSAEKCIAPNLCITTTTTSTDSTTETDEYDFSYSDEEWLSSSSSSSSTSSPSSSTVFQFETTSESQYDFLNKSPRKWNDNSCDANCTNGICLNGTCYCEDGYIGFNCPQFCEDICTDGYVYDSDGSCTCFVGSIEDESDCEVMHNNNCPQFSICILPSRCNCSDGFEKNAIGLCVPQCIEPPTLTDNSTLSGCINGTCVAPNICQCSDPQMILNPLNKFECIVEDDSKVNEVKIVKVSNITHNLWFVCLMVLVLAAIILLAAIAYKKQKDYNVDKKEKAFGAFLYKNATVYYEDPN